MDREVSEERLWLDIKAVCVVVGRDRNTVHRWIGRAVDPLPASRVEGRLWVHRADLDAWMARDRVQQPAPAPVPVRRARRPQFAASDPGINPLNGEPRWWATGSLGPRP